MFEKTRYRILLWRLQARRDAQVRAVRKRVAASSRKKEPPQTRSAIREFARFDLDEVDDDINVLTTQFYVALARRRFVEVPQGEDMWVVSDTFGSRHLTAAGITKIRSSLHAEQKERWEIFQSHTSVLVTLITAITGVLGTVIGVLSFFKSAPPPH
jgi:hypothetical protein